MSASRFPKLDHGKCCGLGGAAHFASWCSLSGCQAPGCGWLHALHESGHDLKLFAMVPWSQQPSGESQTSCMRVWSALVRLRLSKMRLVGRIDRRWLGWGQVTATSSDAGASGMPKAAQTALGSFPAAPKLKTLMEFVAWVVLNQDEAHPPADSQFSSEAAEGVDRSTPSPPSPPPPPPPGRHPPSPDPALHDMKLVQFQQESRNTS